MGLDIINSLKKEKSLTTEQLSIESGVPIGTLNKILNGTTKDPKLETLKALSRVLGCSLDDFDDTTANKEKIELILSKEEKNLLNTFNKLNDLGKKEAHKRVDELTHISKYTVNKNNETSNQVLSLEEAKEYLKSFSSAAYGGFNPDEMTDDQIIETATELKYQFETVTHKYKK